MNIVQTAINMKATFIKGGFFLLFQLRVYRNKPNTNYFFLEAVGAFLAGAFAGAFFAEGLLFDLGVAIMNIDLND